MKTPNPFKPLASRDVSHSSHPKMRSNREYLASETGLELLLIRDDAAYRTAKSRALRQLRNSKDYLAMSGEEREIAEKSKIDQLEAERDTRKRQHAEEWEARRYPSKQFMLIKVANELVLIVVLAVVTLSRWKS